MNSAVLKNYLPWSLRGVSPLLNKYGDGLLFRAVGKTPPIACNPEAETGIHSAVPHRYLNAYLTAIKSFLRYHADIAVFAHDDGSLQEEDKRLIRTHVSGVRIIDRAQADGDFETRVGDEFLAKVRKSYTSYLKLFDPTLVSDRRRIIIVDTDVLFLNRPSEIIEWARTGGSPWYHKSESWLRKDKAGSQQAKRADDPAPSQPTHIQKLVVQRLPEINQALGQNFAFVPGFNSGFIGYEHGTVDYGELKVLLTHLYGIFGDRIFRWGAEQTMHGLVLCGKGAKALPSDQYMVYTNLNGDRAASATFVHFIGEFRYLRFRYPLLAANVIRELKRPL
jgi:hypothetical protein